MTPDLFLLQLFTGVALGTIYVLVALGLSLIFGLLTIVNFAHGQFFMLGAYVGIFVLGLTGNFWLALPIVPIAVGIIGMVVERVLIRPLYGRGVDYPLLLTYGFGLHDSRVPRRLEPSPDGRLTATARAVASERTQARTLTKDNRPPSR